METKRFWVKVFVAILLITVVVFGVKVLAEQIHEDYIKQDEMAILESYEGIKEKNELLRSIPNDFIEEGKGIKFEEIPDNIRYEIKNKSDGNISFNYYIEHELTYDSNPYKVWITLSKDYKVVEEKYGGVELEDFETFKQKQETKNWLGAYLISIPFISVAVVMIIVIQHLIRIALRKKSHS